MITKSTVPSTMSRRRASPSYTCVTGPQVRLLLSMQFVVTRSTADRNLQNGFAGARLNFRCGRLCDRSHRQRCAGLLGDNETREGAPQRFTDRAVSNPVYSRGK